jgi:MFS family permease
VADQTVPGEQRSSGDPAAGSLLGNRCVRPARDLSVQLGALQGIWLPRHGYSFSQTPLWAGIYLVPLTIGFLAAAPVSGILSDKFGARAFTVGGATLTALSFGLLLLVPVNFSYWVFALVLVLNGIGSGLFASPNRAEIMNSVPADSRGAAGGIIATFQNAAFVLSIGIFFSLLIAGLATTLPHALTTGLTAQGVPAAAAHAISKLPPIAVLFAAFLGFNPMKQLLGSHILGHLSPTHASYVTGRDFFPQLMSHPFAHGLTIAFIFAIAANVIAAIFSLLTGRRKQPGAEHESLGSELAAVSGEGVGELTELVTPDIVEDAAESRPRARTHGDRSDG